MSRFDEDFDTSTRLERQFADLEAQTEIPLSPTETDPGTWVRKDSIVAKGDLLAGASAGAVVRQAVGTNGQVLTADSSTTTGLSYTTPAAAAPTTAQFVTLATDAGLTDERVLIGTAVQIVVTDNGAGSTVVISLPATITVATAYQVAGTQVVSARGAAVADATGAGDVVAQLNALLARCRVHGLIST